MNIAIAGAGLLGRILALNLVKDGHNITLFDKDSKEALNSAAFTAAGMLAPFTELEVAEPEVYELGKRSIVLWEKLLEDHEKEEIMQKKGSIITAHGQDMFELEHFITTLKTKTPEASNITPIDNKKIVELEPLLEHHQKAFYLENEGLIDSQKFLKFTTRYLDECENITWREFTSVLSLEANKVILEDKTEEYDWVFDTRGLGAKEHFKDLRGVRGEVFWLETKELDISRPTRLQHPKYSIYIAPRKNTNDEYSVSSSGEYNRYIIGASQIESEDLSAVSVRSTLELMSAVFSMHPNFGEARIVNTKTNARPAFSDNLPKIESQKGLTRINGLFRHGYLMAPAMVENALKEGLYNDRN